LGVADDIGVDAGDGAGLFGRIVGQPFAEEFPGGCHFDRAAIRTGNREPAFQRGAGVAKEQGAAGSLGQLPGDFVPPVELVFTGAGGDVGAAEEAASVGAYEQGQVRLGADEAEVREPLIDDHPAHAEGEGCIGAGDHGDELVGNDAGGAVVGRYRNDA